MARFYSNENIALQVVKELRRLGPDVLTSLEAEMRDRDRLVAAGSVAGISIMDTRGAGGVEAGESFQ